MLLLLLPHMPLYYYGLSIISTNSFSPLSSLFLAVTSSGPYYFFHGLEASNLATFRPGKPPTIMTHHFFIYSHTSVPVSYRTHPTLYSLHFHEKKNVSALSIFCSGLVTLTRMCMSRNATLQKKMLHHSVLISFGTITSSRMN